MLFRIRWIAQVIAVWCLVLWCFSVSSAQQIGTDRPTPTRATTVGTLRVEEYGSGSPAIIFIPGLSCGSWVWDSAVRVYAKTHSVYVLTLAGFDGLPAPTRPGLDSADASLLELVKQPGMNRPILVGHSLGGFLALRFGTEHADLVRAIVAVDGTPVLPTLAQATPHERLVAADHIAAQLTPLSAAQFADGEKVVIATMVSDSGKAEQVARLTAKSDPAATGAYAHDLYLADLRPQLKDLTVPTLEIAPVPTKPAAFEGPQAASVPMSKRAAGYQHFYASLFPGAPNVRVVTIPDSLHFVMVDQPQVLYDAISSFIASLLT